MSAEGLRGNMVEMRPALVRMLCARGATPEEAEDIFQDLFVRLDTAQVGSVLDERAYLYRMADNLWIDRRRSEVRRSLREQNWVSERAMDQPPSAEQSYSDRQRLALVSAALARLPERTVEIFRRFRLEEEQQREIADSLGISLSAVEKHLQRAYRAVTEVRRSLDAGSDDPRRLRDNEG